MAVPAEDEKANTASLKAEIYGSVTKANHSRPPGWNVFPRLYHNVATEKYSHRHRWIPERGGLENHIKNLPAGHYLFNSDERQPAATRSTIGANAPGDRITYSTAFVCRLRMPQALLP